MLRRKVSDELAEWKERRHKCLLIRGPRQVGKTTVVEGFAREHHQDHVRIDLSENRDAHEAFSSNLDVDTVIARLCLILDRDIRPGETLIILDGIQECPRARASLKSFSDDGRYDVIAIGTYPGVEDSHLFKMECRRRGELPPLLPMGYEEHIDMHGLDFEEFLWALGWNEDTTRDIRGHIARRESFGDTVLEDLLSRFGEFMTVGGMPGCVDRYLVRRNISDAHGVMAGIVDMVHDDIRRYDNGRIGARTWACLRSVTDQLTRADGRFVLSHIDGGSASFGRYAESLVWIWSSGVGNFCMGAGKLEKPLEAFLDLRSFRLYLSDTGVLTYLFGRDDDLVRGRS